MKNRAFTLIEVAIVVAVLGVLGAWLFKPKALDGASRDAKQSTEAAAQARAANEKQGATAAGKISVVNDVAHTLPESKEKDFIEKETESALGDLPKPDPEARLKSIERKVAVFSGDLQKIASLYEKDNANSLKLQKQVDEGNAAVDAINLKFTVKAAEALALERQRNSAIALVVLAGLVIAYLKFYGIGRGTLGKMAADVRAGVPALQAFDTHLAPWMHAGVYKASQLATPHEEK